jgi:hypothetical protein
MEGGACISSLGCLHHHDVHYHNIHTLIVSADPPPPGSQAEAERRKRASVLESEGLRQSKINVAEADKQQVGHT